MNDIRGLLSRAVDSPPPAAFDLDSIMLRERRRRRRRAAAAATGGVLAVAMAGGGAGVAWWSSPPAVRTAVRPSASATVTTTSITVQLPPSRIPNEPAGTATTRLRATTVDQVRSLAPRATASWVAVYGNRHDAPFTYYGSQGGYQAGAVLSDASGKSTVHVHVDPGTGGGAFTATCGPDDQPRPYLCRVYQTSDRTVVVEQATRTGRGVVRYVVSVMHPDGTGVEIMEVNYSETDQPPQFAPHVYDPEPQGSAPLLPVDQLVALGRAITLYPAAYPGAGLETSHPKAPLGPTASRR